MKYRSIRVLLTILLLFPMIRAELNSGMERVSFLDRCYAGLNPIAIPAAFPLRADWKRYLPIASGLEYGVAVCAGFETETGISFETRLALGKPHKLAFVPQLHAGFLYYPWHRWEFLPHQLYCGTFLKFWDYYNTLSQIHFCNLGNSFVIGYRLPIRSFFADFRINQTTAVLSWSSLENTGIGTDWCFSPWPSFFPVIPTFTLTVGYQLKTP